MSRPLLSKSAAELEQAVARNCDNAAELKLILAELRHRKTAQARKLEIMAKAHLAAIAAKPTEKPAPSLEDLNEAMASNWHDPVRLRQLQLPLGKAPDAAGYLRDRLAQRIAELEGKVTPAPKPSPRPTAATRKKAPMSTAPAQPTASLSTRPRIDPERKRQTDQAVAQLRTKLIDLTRRSPLISFKHGGRASNLVRIVDERPDLVFAGLGEGAMGFEPLPGQDTTPRDEATDAFRIAYENALLVDEAFLAATEKLGDDERDAEAWQRAERALRARVRAAVDLPPLDYGKTLDIAALAKAHGFDPAYDLLPSDDDDVAAHHTDSRLRVLLVEKDLEKRLKAIWDRYRSHERETGLHTLFLIYGVVQWYDEQTKDDPQFAPALLQAVNLQRKQVRGRYEYSLVPHDDGLQANVALAEKMRQHWGLEMPALRAQDTPESYFVRLDLVLAKGTRLKLRRFLTLAVLPFPQMVLWKDLDPALWQDDGFAAHRLLPALLGAAPMGGEPGQAEPYDIDAPEWAAQAPALIRPADASQHSALIETAHGHDLAVEGPPGTGKSETITNMIATAVEQGKRVLFVAEKQAALRVVADRLRASGFGALLLELHGETARRDDVYKGIRERIGANVAADAAALERARDELLAQRDRIRTYLRLIRTPLGALRLTAYDAAWRDIRLRALLPQGAADRYLGTVPMPDPQVITSAQLADMRAALGVFAQAVEELDRAALGSNRTRWLAAGYLPVFDHKRQLARAGDAARAALAVHQAAQPLAQGIGVTVPGPLDDLDAVARQLADIPNLPVERDDVVIAGLRDTPRARALLRQQARWRQLLGKLEQHVAQPAGVAPDLVERLAQHQAADVAPASLAEARMQRDAMAALRRHLDKSAPARERLTRLLGLDPDLPVAARGAIATALVVLDGHAAPVKALMRADLLDPLVELGMAQEAERAAALQQEHERLATQFHDGGFDADQDELNRLAQVLEESGLFARLCGGQYRAARKRAAQVLRDQAERAQMADALRAMSRHLRNATRFDGLSPARAWFPPVMWQGTKADFHSLDQARQALAAARQVFLQAGAPDLLRAWLALPAEDRALIASLAGEDAASLAGLAEQGFGGAPLGPACQALDEAMAVTTALIDLLEQIGTHAEAPLVQEGETLAGRLQALHGAEAEFASLAQDRLFGWIADIGDTLEPLAQAVAFADGLAGREDPLGLNARLCTTDAPVALWAAVHQAAPPWLAAARTWQEACGTLSDEADLEIDDLLADDAPVDWASLAQTLSTMAGDEAGARLAANLHKYEHDLRAEGFDTLAQAAIDGLLPASCLPDLYELAVVAGLLQHYISADGHELARIGGLSLKAAQEAFVKTDKLLHRLEAKRIVARRLDDKAPWGIDHGPRGNWTDGALIHHELSLIKPRTPLRDVVHRAGAALQALKPVWMMSPASVAQYIRPGSLAFDLLVIDEASQMRPEFALSAILRGQQFVVVGDANQLPPADHFQLATPIDGSGDGDDGLGVDGATESILDLANQRIRRKRRLRCAYRFQHERLINFSNRKFYESNLVVFPSPRGEDDALLGVHYRYVPAIHADTVYEASVNQREAQEVIDEAYRLMIAYPEHSIGIAAMNAKQTELIQNEFDRLILERPEVRSYVQQFAGTVEEFFIKNLENVQGDERDIILVSTVYGPGKDGNVRQNFGLMSRDVGWRRLNVLVTRAKLSTRVFTSLRPEDIKLTETSSKGPRAFRDYLTYALGAAEADNDAGGVPDSDFEVFVAERLEAAGYEVIPQVGVDQFRIDLGVRHADYGGGFIAGIECDGAPFHTGMTVRDRDRIRQAQLENLGWHIYRIWSVDWFADPLRQTDLLLDWLARRRDEAVAALPARPIVPDAVPKSVGMMAEAVACCIDTTTAPPPTQPDHALHAIARPTEPPVPVGKPMTPLDGITWYAQEPGRLYTVWHDDEFVGDVTVLSRPTMAAGIYGNQLRTPKPEYEGRVEHTGALFKTHDIYQAVREVMRRWRDGEGQ